jgi:menaquinone-dependent protoporphyrinogen oxidase
MNKQIRILIGYASNHGSTVEIADFIGKNLKSIKTTVDIQPVVKVESVENYDVIIIGSPIYYGKWLVEIPEFVENNLEKLIKIPVACFITCMAAIKTDNDNIKEANGHLIKSLAQIPRIKPFKTGFFAGKLDFKKCTLIETILMKIIMIWKGAEAGDYRDWSKIKSWTSAVLTAVELLEP